MDSSFFGALIGAFAGPAILSIDKRISVPIGVGVSSFVVGKLSKGGEGMETGVYVVSSAVGAFAATQFGYGAPLGGLVGVAAWQLYRGATVKGVGPFL